MTQLVIGIFVVWALAVMAIVRWFSVVSSELEEEAAEVTLPLSGPMPGAAQTTP
jgi:uncharacterized protein YggT (Ycf19 family)